MEKISSEESILEHSEEKTNVNQDISQLMEENLSKLLAEIGPELLSMWEGAKFPIKQILILIQR